MLFLSRDDSNSRSTVLSSDALINWTNPLWHNLIKA